jgi:hypothetical protein
MLTSGFSRRIGLGFCRGLFGNKSTFTVAAEPMLAPLLTDVA